MYLIDSNSLIQAKNRHYSFAICQGFWDFLNNYNSQQKLYSTNKVKDELLRGNDELSDWAKNNSQFFLMTLSWTVVTEEHKKKGQIRIPKICEKMDVSCINIYELLERENIRFSLSN